MNKDLMITKQDLIDWIDRPPSNDDLDLATFIATRLEKFYDLEDQLQQKENKEKEIREYIKEHSTTINFKTMRADYNLNMNELLEILDKEVN